MIRPIKFITKNIPLFIVITFFILLIHPVGGDITNIPLKNTILKENGISGMEITNIQVNSQEIMSDELNKIEKGYSFSTADYELKTSIKNGVGAKQDLFLTNKQSKMDNSIIITVKIDYDRIWWNGTEYKITDKPLILQPFYEEGKLIIPNIFFGEEYKRINFKDIGEKGGYAIVYEKNKEYFIDLILDKISIEKDQEFYLDPVYYNKTDGFYVGGIGINSPSGIYFNNTDFWIDDYNDDFLYHFDYKTKTNQSDGFSLIGLIGITDGRQFNFNGTDIWITDYADNYIYHFNYNTKTKINDGINATLLSIPNARGIAFNNTDFWITSVTNGFNYHLDYKTRTNQSDGFRTAMWGNLGDGGMSFNNTDFWMVDNTKSWTDHISYATKLNQSDGFDMKPFGITNSQGMTFNNTDYWVVDNTDDFVYHISKYLPPISGNASSGWYDTSFTKCKNITITNVGTTTLTNFPLYINLSYVIGMGENFNAIRFVDRACNDNIGASLMQYGVENYTASKQADFWVNIPSLPVEGAIISVYYYNTTSTSADSNNQSGVWDANFKGVWHMGSQTGFTNDSTSNNNTGKQYGSVFNSTLAVDGASNLDGATGYFNMSYSPSTGLTGNFTVEAWVSIYRAFKPTDNNYKSIVIRNSLFWYGYGLDLYERNADSSARLYAWTRGTDGIIRGTDTFVNGVWTANTTYHVVGKVNGTSVVVYWNGVERSSALINGYYPLNIAGSSLLIGNDGYNAGKTWPGKIDEVRISNIARTNDWINMTYQNIANQNKTISFGTEETYTAPANTCTYSGSGNWLMTWDDNCTITSPVKGDGNSDFILQGCGNFVITSTLSGFKNYFFIPNREGHQCHGYVIGGRMGE